jgi:hypothetical protein
MLLGWHVFPSEVHHTKYFTGLFMIHCPSYKKEWELFFKKKLGEKKKLEELKN